MIDFIIQFIMATLGVTVTGLLFWKIIKRTIRDEVGIKCLEKKIAKSDESKDSLKVGDVVTWYNHSLISDNKLHTGIYIGNECGNDSVVDESGYIQITSWGVTKMTRKYNIKINFDPIPTETEELEKRIKDLESTNNNKNKNSERNQNETTNKI